MIREHSKLGDPPGGGVSFDKLEESLSSLYVGVLKSMSVTIGKIGASGDPSMYVGVLK